MFCGAPRQAAALAAGQEVDPLAAQIGAANTLVRRPDGSLAAFNTDCFAAISAIEAGILEAAGQSTPEAAAAAASGGIGGSGGGGPSPLEGKSMLVVGAGGAGRALAFGAARAGAQVLEISLPCRPPCSACAVRHDGAASLRT